MLIVSRFDLLRPIAIIDPVTILPRVERPRCHRYAIGAADIKEDEADPSARPS